jgi:predicted acetyltransferase
MTDAEFELIPANEAEHDQLLRNLYQLYLYEFSYFTEEWRVQADGKFDEADLENCWDDKHRRVFLISVDKQWVGFAILDLDLPDSDGSTVNELSEYFIMPPYRQKGLGERIARKIFQQHKGQWELCIVETNTKALHFWRKVLARYTKDNYTETHRPEDDDYIHVFNNADA